MAKKSHFFSGVIIGAIAGAATALFVAPKKGSELREDAMDKYNEIKEDPSVVLRDVRDFSTEKFQEVKAKFESGEYSAERAKSFLLEQKDNIKQLVAERKVSKEEVEEFFVETKGSLKKEAAAAEAELGGSQMVSDYSWTESEKSED